MDDAAYQVGDCVYRVTPSRSSLGRPRSVPPQPMPEISDKFQESHRIARHRGCAKHGTERWLWGLAVPAYDECAECSRCFYPGRNAHSMIPGPARSGGRPPACQEQADHERVVVSAADEGGERAGYRHEEHDLRRSLPTSGRGP